MRQNKKIGQFLDMNWKESVWRFCLGDLTMFVAVCLTALLFPTVTSAFQKEANVLPARLGSVIYQENSQHPNQIYIVAQSHRSPVDGSSANDTDEVQAEIYRIGEWLVLNRKVEFLLPEGYFSRVSALSNPATSPRISEQVLGPIHLLDNDTLIASLSDTSRFVNADMLLHSHLDLPLRQIEDKKLYLGIKDMLGNLPGTEAQEQDSLLSVLQYHQRKRSGFILQNIPKVFEEEFLDYERTNHNAMLTIGLAHINDMVGFLTKGKIEIGELTGQNCGAYSKDLDLLKEDYGITVIVPRTLAEKFVPLTFAKML